MYCIFRLYALPLHPHSDKKNASADPLAQPVEHIPFKDGVLGSNPKRITFKLAPRAGFLALIRVVRFSSRTNPELHNSNSGFRIRSIRQIKIFHLGKMRYVAALWILNH